jgi:hypothetical protein
VHQGIADQHADRHPDEAHEEKLGELLERHEERQDRDTCMWAQMAKPKRP